MKDFTSDKLEKLVNSPADKFGVTHLELFYNKKEDKMYCILEAPNEEAIWKHHEASGLKCEFITEIQQVKTDKLLKTEKMQILGEMSSRVSHDLRNPLNIIKNSVDIMNLKWKDSMDSEMKEYLAKIERGVANINSIMDDIINFAQTRPLKLENNSLLSAINRAVESVHIPENIEMKITQNDISFEFDLAKIEVLFINLITNSIHAIGGKTGEITIEFEEKDKNKIHVKIIDSGPGIPEDLLPRIFEPLFTTKQYGTGLGLPSCKNIVEQHGGTIDITNNPTTVTLVIPKHISSLTEMGPRLNQ